MRERAILFGVGTIALSGFFVLVPRPAHAASLYFSPDAETVVVGQAFTVAVDVSSADQAMNAASGNISFPADKLQVLSISKSNSIINLRIRDPSFSNSIAGGNIHFEGITLNPGYTGSGGTVISVTFQAISAGSASLSFSDGGVLANDGNGTNILGSLGTASYSILPASGNPGFVATSVPPGTAAGSSTPGSRRPPPVATNNWMLIFWSFILLIFLFVLAVIAIAMYLADRFHPRGRGVERRELRDDLRRIEKEMESDRSASSVDLSPGGVRKKRERIRREIEHLEKDIKRGLKED